MAKPKKQTGFKCGTCGKWHDELLTDVGARLPDEVWKLDYLTQYQRARYNADLCTLDESRYFLRGFLPVPFTYRKGCFGWGVWLEVSRKDHDAYVAYFAGRTKQPLLLTGKLANNLKAYNRTIGLQATIEVTSSENRPTVTLQQPSRNRLAVEQRQGIDATRHHAIADLYTKPAH